MCLYIHMLCWSYAHVCTWFDDICSIVCILGCLNAHVFICTHTFLITCLHVYLLWWSHASMFTYLDNHILLCLHALIITCSHIYMLQLSHAHMPLCPRAHMFGCFDDHMLTCTYAVMLTCSYLLGLSQVYTEAHVLPCSLLDAYFLDCSHAWMVTFLNAHTLTCFDDHMLPSSHALVIKCNYVTCFDNNMLPCTFTLIFTCLISIHMSTHLVDDMSLCLED